MGLLAASLGGFRLATFLRVHGGAADRGQVDLLFGRGRGEDHDLAVTHAAGAGDLDNATDRLVDAGVVDPKIDFHLGQKSEAEFAFAVLVEIILLTAEPFDLTHRASLQRSPLEAFEHLFSQVGTNNGDDLFQGNLGRGGDPLAVELTTARARSTILKGRSSGVVPRRHPFQVSIINRR